MVKEVYVSINFHAHEPLWSLQSRLVRMTKDSELSGMLPSRDYLKERMDAGDDLYSLATDLARELQIPFGIEISNELIQQLKPYRSTIENIEQAFKDKVIYPILGHAHHTHMEFLSDDEITQEIRRNREALRRVFNAEISSPEGYFPSECSLESRRTRAIKKSGVDYLIFPHIEKQEHLIDVENGSVKDTIFKPFYVTHGEDKLLALPRSFMISQEIWRPLTKLLPDKARDQGYCLGLFPVLDEEFKTGKTVRFPINFEEAVGEYSDVFKKAIARCPNGGLLLFMQDLELMGVGREMFSVLQESLRRIKRAGGKTRVTFTSLKNYAKTYIERFGNDLPSVRFRRICWAPEIHGELRLDGLYLPLGVKEYRGIDGSKVYSEDPFVFWTPGSHIVKIFSQLLHECLSPEPPEVTAEQLMKVNYDISKLRVDSAVSFLHLLQKRADNWGWRPDEDRQKWSFLYGYLILNHIQELIDKKKAPQFGGLREDDIMALRVYPEIFLETRTKYLTEGLRLNETADVSQAERKLKSVRDLTRRLYSDIEHLKVTNRNLKEGKARFPELISSLKVFCKDFCLATDLIQRVWAASGNPDFLVLEMYKYLHTVYPPLYPNLKKILKES